MILLVMPVDLPNIDDFLIQVVLTKELLLL